MNDEPTPNAPQGAGTPDPLDDTQRIDVPRYAPTPDPRPDARWAWSSPGSQAPGDRWYEPAPSEPGIPPAAGAGLGRPGRWSTPPPAYAAPVQPAQASQPRPPAARASAPS